MTSNTLISIIGGIVILALFVLCIVIRMKRNPSLYDREKAQEFLKGLSDTFYDKMIEIIVETDFKSFNSLEEVEASILSQIYDSMWDYVSTEAELAAKDDIITVMVLKALDKETVDKFISSLIDNKKVCLSISKNWYKVAEKSIKETSENVVAEEQKLTNEFADSTKYNESFEDKLPDAVVEEPTEEELAALNPPTDEEKEYDPETDSSVEVVNEEDIYFYDSKGRRRNKKTGRYA